MKCNSKEPCKVIKPCAESEVAASAPANVQWPMLPQSSCGALSEKTKPGQFQLRQPSPIGPSSCTQTRDERGCAKAGEVG